ncbi:MAG: hypothetical protein PVG05_02395 [Gammaproteobacteria bacterium]|jgi:hypothetical protein
MKLTILITAVISALLLTPITSSAATEASEVETLRNEVQMLRQQLEELEARLDAVDSGETSDIGLPSGFIQDEDEARGFEPKFGEFEWSEPEYDFDHSRRLEQLAEQDAAAGYEAMEEKPELDVNLGGAVWINYAYQDWVGDDQARKNDLRLDNLRLSFDSSYGDFLMSAQYRFYSFSRALHHAWIGYEFEEDNRVELGVSQVPFGILPFGSHNFWFLIPFFVGLEDDYDAGVKWHYGAPEDWTIDLAFYLNEEYGDPTDLDRYSVDVVRDGDQQNDERNQFNARVAYDWKFSDRAHTEFGISGRYGSLDNRTTEKSGDYWAAAVHANAFFGPWNLMLEAMRYEYDPENPAGVSDDLMLMGNLGSKRLVASEADIFVANLAYDFGDVWGPIERLNCYNDYSYMRKDENSFKNSQINDTGCVVAMGPFWIWIDMILGKNAWYLNDSETDSGFGPGGTDDWEKRFNVNFEWYF